MKNKEETERVEGGIIILVCYLFCCFIIIIIIILSSALVSWMERIAVVAFVFLPPRGGILNVFEGKAG